ncbi:MAG: hypothetical protein GY757_16560, partial [bacterium]|nr:hypothetical protein [bacterium]
YLCAYVVPAKGTAPEAADMEAELREHLLQTLPEYMEPQFFVKMEQLPLLPNRKIDRKALPKPELQTGEKYAPPTNKTEETLVEIWTEILELEPQAEAPGISIDADFFRMGGHSLKATMLISKIHKEFNVKIPLTTVFQTPTIKGIAKKIKDATPKNDTAITPVEKKEYYTLSPAQLRIYIQQHMAGESTVYNMPAVLAIKGEADGPRLEKAFRKMIQRH